MTAALVYCQNCRWIIPYRGTDPDERILFSKCGHKSAKKPDSQNFVLLPPPEPMMKLQFCNMKNWNGECADYEAKPEVA